MRRTKDFKWISIFIIIIFFLKIPIGYANSYQSINDDIQKMMDDVRTQYQIPGIEVSISFSGEDTPRDFVSGTTTIHGLTPIQPDNFFQIGSETKSFVATIILQLEAQGSLSIEDPIYKWLPQLPFSWRNITIKQLLNHTSGIFNITEVEEFWEIETKSNLQKQWTPEELINLVVNQPSYFEPGTGFHYSNTNYILAGMIVRNITGHSVEDEMKNRLFTQLNLSHTHYFSRAYPAEILQSMAHGYSDGFPEKDKDITNGNMSMADAAGAIISTSHDTAVWLRTLLTSSSLLPETQQTELMSLVDQMGKPLPSESKKSGYGLGIARHIDAAGNEIWFHGGSTIGYLSNMLWIKCNDIVVTLTTNYNSEKSSIGNQVLTDNLITYLLQFDASNQCKTSRLIEKNSLVGYKYF